MIEWGVFLGGSLRLGVWTVYIIIITTLFSFQAQNTKTIRNSTVKGTKLGGRIQLNKSSEGSSQDAVYVSMTRGRLQGSIKVR